MSHGDNDEERPETGAETRTRQPADRPTPLTDSSTPPTNISAHDSPKRGTDDPRSTSRTAEIEAVENILDGEIDDPQLSSQLVRSAWSGPLPPPDDLAAYERILPGAAARAFAMAERALDIREARENIVRTAVEGQVHIQTIIAEGDREVLRRGQYLAAGISCLVAILAAGGLFITPWAVIGFAVPLSQVAVSLIRTISVDRHDDPKEDDNRNKTNNHS